MVVDEAAEEKPALKLGFTDGLAVAALAVANVAPLLWWSLVEGWVAGVAQGLQLASR